jgi:hypothetical protein
VENVERIRTGTRRDWEQILGRVGLVAKGVSYARVGVLAIGVAIGVGGPTTCRQGALRSLAGDAFGKVVLVLLACGLAAYALWRLLQAVQTDKWTKRLGYLGRAAVYASLTFSAAKIVAGAGGGSSQNAKTHKATAVVLAWPGGRWLVGAAALIVIGVGFWNLYRGISRKFEDKWIERSDEAQRWAGRAGVVGHIARFVVFGLIGVFALEAAIDYDPKRAVGLDGALQRLAQHSYGSFLLGVTAAGFVAYAVYCFFDARYRDVTA